MLNECKVEGKVLSIWETNKGFMSMKIAVPHPHFENGERKFVESMITPIFTDKDKVMVADVLVGDKVRVTGYIYNWVRVSPAGNTHQELKFYADDIEIISFVKG